MSSAAAAVTPVPAVDRVLAEHLRHQASAAQEKARQHWETSQEQTKARLEVEAELELQREENKRLKDEVRRLKERHHEEQRRGIASANKLKDIEAERDQLSKQRDHWHNGCARALTARDAAVGAAVALRDALRDAPGHESGETAALLRAQLIACRDRKNAHKSRANEQQNRADSEHLRVEALEKDVAALQMAVAASREALAAANAAAAAAAGSAEVS